MQRLNIIKHIEEKTGKDIFNDFYEIKIILDGEYYNYKPLYCFSKKGPYMYESVHKTGIADKTQIQNRIQYIKQSGYEFKEYLVNNNVLTIIFE